ncbi:MAG: hypothetical protein P1P85_01820 [Patescibacteria group bacterium]|nr:hypothetical protein [Patescibacteria group bacterium]
MADGSNRSSIVVTSNKNKVENIWFKKCNHCQEKIPDVGACSECGTDYIHIHTVENYETGFLHFIYTCSGCAEDQRKAQKVVKINNGNGDATNKVYELVKDFLN